MAITNEFMDAVQTGNLLRVRIMLKDSLLIDPTATQFDEMIQYSNDQMGSVYTEHDGEVLYFDKNYWDEGYLNQQMVTVVNNFSKERVDLLKDMVRYLYKEKVDKMQEEREYDHSKVEVSRKQIGVGVTAVGAVATVAGICTSHAMVTIGGVAVAAVGIALIVSDKGDK